MANRKQRAPTEARVHETNFASALIISLSAKTWITKFIACVCAGGTRVWFYFIIPPQSFTARQVEEAHPLIITSFHTRRRQIGVAYLAALTHTHALVENPASFLWLLSLPPKRAFSAQTFLIWHIHVINEPHAGRTELLAESVLPPRAHDYYYFQHTHGENTKLVCL